MLAEVLDLIYNILVLSLGICDSLVLRAQVSHPLTQGLQNETLIGTPMSDDLQIDTVSV